MKMDINKLERFKSDYLSYGFKEEDFIITGININQNKLTATIDLTDCFLSRNSKFHLAVPLAFRIISQLAIIFTCTKIKYDKKPGEVYLREITLKCNKPITKSINIQIQMEIEKFRLMEDYFYFKGNVQIENGTMFGNGSLIVPILQKKINEPYITTPDSLSITILE